MTQPHLDHLEAEAISIFRECVRPDAKTVLMYSIGKDSSVLLHLARKAFFPAPIPFPLLHVDTGWKFKEMYDFRDSTVQRLGLDLSVHTNPEGLAAGVNPFTHGSAHHTDVMKTQALKQALDAGGFDVVIG
ncbi:MAG: phosphoadenosine phosphosulfate reductase family protein, partial [Bacteriovoracia bacterium]